HESDAEAGHRGEESEVEVGVGEHLRQLASPLIHQPPGPAAGADAGEVEQVAQEERSEEHTSELQSRFDLVCRLLLEKKKTDTTHHTHCSSTSPPRPAIYTLSLHDALPISRVRRRGRSPRRGIRSGGRSR